jgi:hypothetical protein
MANLPFSLEDLSKEVKKIGVVKTALFALSLGVVWNIGTVVVDGISKFILGGAETLVNSDYTPVKAVVESYKDQLLASVLAAILWVFNNTLVAFYQFGKDAGFSDLGIWFVILVGFVFFFASRIEEVVEFVSWVLSTCFYGFSVVAGAISNFFGAFAPEDNEEV